MAESMLAPLPCAIHVTCRTYPWTPNSLPHLGCLVLCLVIEQWSLPERTYMTT